MRKSLMALLVVGAWGCGGYEASDDRGTFDLSKVRVSLEINGRRYSPGEAAAHFDGQVVSLFVDEEAQRRGFAYAFTSEEEMGAFLHKWELEHPRVEKVEAGLSDSIFYENSNNAGASITLPENTPEPDFTRFGCFLRMQCNYWNDRISSVTPSRINRYTILYEHINYGGASVWLFSGVNNYNLADLNFDDVASSASFLY
jgi:hypothetical protein